MKRIKLVCVGKNSKPFCRDGCDEYLKRLRSAYDVAVVEIPEQPTIKKECDEIVGRTEGYVVLMDVGGDEVDSVGFADLLKREHEKRDVITFVIGGASGVDERVKQLANKRISFGRVTYPHQIARLLLCEQIYRASTIIKGVPYHK
ncbi:MAG: 23S rRNA (pseudouridine(1915)-N(3))-methyltransferase RlmH [Clostridiales bacterium]|nr:23S rRNA (pseudouridine(1915)-N(3))-methyltransferase RlmH [Clostridiales bacterium]